MNYLKSIRLTRILTCFLLVSSFFLSCKPKQKNQAQTSLAVTTSSKTIIKGKAKCETGEEYRDGSCQTIECTEGREFVGSRCEDIPKNNINLIISKSDSPQMEKLVNAIAPDYDSIVLVTTPEIETTPVTEDMFIQDEEVQFDLTCPMCAKMFTKFKK